MCQATRVEGICSGERPVPGNGQSPSACGSKSVKRRRAELNAQLRAKRNRYTSSDSTCNLGENLGEKLGANRVGNRGDTGGAGIPTTTTDAQACYRAILTQASCPHLSRWISEERNVGMMWDFESYYGESETRLVEEEALLPDALAFLTGDLHDEDRAQVVAIDLEWRPDRFKDRNNPVALIQLATTTRCVLLRTVNWDTSGSAGLPDALGRFFSEASNRFFVGFSWASGDEKKMQSSFGVGKDVFSNFCDLQELAQVLGYGKKCGLAWLTNEVVGAELPKDVARSDWEATALTEAQQQYSALDVFSLHAILAGWKMALNS